ncbi:MAG: helix-turn-helix domain-containing protein [Candidatus Omnitrophota bacterium]
MPEKLLTLEELSDYLGIKKDKISSLAEEGVISAYKIGGELLRFRREQIDAIRSEIESRITDDDRIVVSEAREKIRATFSVSGEQTRSTFSDKIADLFYFCDFYILSAILIVALLVVIFRG